MAVKIDEVRYLTNLTRDHYNLLKETVNGKAKTFTYDGNVVSFEKEGTRNYYQLDELGSTMYLTGTDGAAYSPYSYDPFGNRIDPKTGRKADKHSYTKEGNIIQPFAFTGYREEESGLYYAQARSYDPRAGRFTGEDKVRGLVTLPDSYNRYIYCYNIPTLFVDQNGLFPTILVGAGLGALIGTASYLVGAAVSGDKITLEGVASSAASGAVVGGLMGAGVTSPTVLGAAGGAAGSLVSGAMEGKRGKELLATTANGALQGGVMGTAFATMGPGATVVTGAVMKGGFNLIEQAFDDKPGIDWVSVARHTAGGAAETATAMFGFSKMNNYLAGKQKSVVGQKTEAIYNKAKAAYNKKVEAAKIKIQETGKAIKQSFEEMFSPRYQMSTPEGFTVEVPAYENGTNYSKGNSNSSGGVPVGEKTTASNGLDYQSNSKHTPGGQGNRRNAGIEPKNSLELFEQSVPSSKCPDQRYAYDENGTIHRFFNDGNGTWYWSGSTNQGPNSLMGKDVPIDIKRLFNIKVKGW